MDTYLIQSVYHSAAGVVVTVQIGRNEEKTEEEFLISPELWCFGYIAAGHTLTAEEYEEIGHCALISRARARTRDILAFSPHSRTALVQKLRRHNLPDEIIEEVADWAVEQHFIREEQQALLAAETYHRRKYWGRKRIAAELLSRGYGAEAVQAAVSSIADEAYLRALTLIIKKKYGEMPEDPMERQKMVLSLLRLGYTGQEIKEAMAAAAVEA